MYLSSTTVVNIFSEYSKEEFYQVLIYRSTSTNVLWCGVVFSPTITTGKYHNISYKFSTTYCQILSIIVGKETHRWPIINGSAMVLIILRDNLCLFVHFIKEVWLVKQEWIYFTWMFWRFSSFTAQFWFEYIFAPLIIFTAKIFYFGLKFYDFMILSFFPI